MTTETEGAPEGVTEDTAAAVEVEADEILADEQAGDDAAADDEGQAEQPKPKKTTQERINEVTKARREAERREEQSRRDAEYWREQALRTAPQTPAREPASEDAEPDPANYEHGELDARFIREHATYHARKAFREETANAEAKKQQRDRLDTFESAAKTAAAKHADFFEVVGRDYSRAAALCTPAMSEAILDSEHGPDLAYHLATNPDEARRIAALDPISQVRNLGRLEARFAEPAKLTPKTATDAPAPTPHVRGVAGRFTVDGSTTDFAAFEKLAGGV
jgi:hypothetical protein